MLASNARPVAAPVAGLTLARLISMMDRILARTLSCSVMALIVATAMASLLLSYRGLYRLVSNHVEAGMVWLFAGAGLGVGAYLLCRHRHELADS
jgi:hypothetical protein